MKARLPEAGLLCVWMGLALVLTVPVPGESEDHHC